ncbi:MAG: hypothetical protein ACE5J9_00060 [Methanosarcinales archaeon]
MHQLIPENCHSVKRAFYSKGVPPINQVIYGLDILTSAPIFVPLLP